MATYRKLFGAGIAAATAGVIAWAARCELIYAACAQIITRNNVIPAISEDTSPNPPCIYKPVAKAIAESAITHGTTTSRRTFWKRFARLALCWCVMNSESVSRGFPNPPILHSSGQHAFCLSSTERRETFAIVRYEQWIILPSCETFPASAGLHTRSRTPHLVVSKGDVV